MQGICFKEPLFHASIERRKNQTRRITAPQPDTIRHYADNDGPYLDGVNNSRLMADGKILKPRYKVGEVVYLKEPYQLVSRGPGVYEVHYMFGGEPKLIDVTELMIPPIKIANIFSQQSRSKNGYANKLFMPEWAARYFIQMTAICSERLQDISNEDCIKEGIIEGACSGGTFWGVRLTDGKYISYSDTPREAYATLIDKINGKSTWDSNPFVWVYDYKITEKP